MKFALYISIIFILFLNSCSLKPQAKLEKITLVPKSFTQFNNWKKENFTEFWPSFIKSCEKFLTLPTDYRLNFGKFYFAGTMKDWHPLCERAEFIIHKNLQREFLEQNFNVFQVVTKAKDSGLFTGYYESDLKGSLRKTTKFKYPIYKAPLDLGMKRPYYTRSEIESGILDHHNLELMWVDDPVELFFMHIQGSGRIHLADGKVVRVGYAGQNGHPFVPIGRVLRERMHIHQSQVNANALKRWLRHHPEYANNIMNINESYIFFRMIDAIDGPIGAQGIELTSLRSLAVDRRYYPLGIPAWVSTNLPPSSFGPQKPLSRLVMLQDTGGAIKGPIRADLFFGHGKKAEEQAGNMKYPGKIFVLLPKTVHIE